MPRGKKIDPIVYFMEKAGAHSMVLKNNPQCEDCEHLHFISFNYDYFIKTVRKKYCLSCLNFNGTPPVSEEVEL